MLQQFKEARTPAVEEVGKPRMASDRMRRFPLFVTLGYLVFGALWIALSDAALEWLFGEGALLLPYQTWKGWLFIAVTAALLHAVLATAWRRMSAYRLQLDLALSAANGGIWDRNLEDGSLHLSPHLKAILGYGENELVNAADAWREMIHPADRALARASIRRAFADPRLEHLAHFRVRSRDGGYRWIQAQGGIMRDGRGKPVRLLGVCSDITRMVEQRAAVREMLMFDPTTGLMRRDPFARQLDRSLAAEPNLLIPVIQLNLSSVADVNHSFGFDAGDDVLRRFARRLIEFGGSDALAAHIGGDEFVIAFLGLTSTTQAQDQITKLLQSVNAPVQVSDQDIRLDITAGIAFYPADGNTAETLLTAAGLATQEAHRDESRTICYYAKALDESHRRRFERSNALRDAVRRDEFTLHYQPVIAAADKTTIGLEALIRWQHPTEGVIGPAEFIPLAEARGLIGEIGTFALRQGCRQCSQWPDGGGRFFLAVNLSPRQLVDGDLPRRVAETIAQFGWPAERLELEITETALTDDFVAAAERLQRLRDLGVGIAIDDFGTGYSTLTALLRLPISKIKIDRSFVQRYGADREATTIVDTVLQLANRLDMETTAEGVETAEQFARLRDAGCRTVQGYLFSKPVPAGEAESLLRCNWQQH